MEGDEQGCSRARRFGAIQVGVQAVAAGCTAPALFATLITLGALVAASQLSSRA